MPDCDNRHWRNQRDGLAIRLIGHEVRNSTIRSWTGLTDRQIRQLCWNLRSASATKQLRRRRGRPPRQASYFTRNPHLQLEAAQLYSAFTTCGLFEYSPREPSEKGSLAYRQLFCDAYETHLQLFLASSHISFERAWFLLELLKNGNEFQIAHCRHCQGTYLRHGGRARRACPCCTLNAIG